METHNSANENTAIYRPFLSPIAPPSGLYRRVVGRVHILETRALYIRRAFFGGVSFLSLAGLVPSFLYLSGAFALSSFGQYLSLIASDGDVLLINWKEFAFSLIESLPLMGITLVSIMIFGLIYSVAALMEQSRTHPLLQIA